MKILIIGAGKLGYNIAQTLNIDHDIILIDVKDGILEKIEEHLDVMTVKGNGISLRLLQSIAISEFDLAIATTNSDELNILACMTTKKLGCKKSIARIRNPEYTNQLEFFKENMDIDYVINPELATADEISRYVTQKYSFFHGKYAGGEISVIDCKASDFSFLIDKRIKDLKLTELVNFVAIFRNGESIIPYGNTVIEKNDTMYLIGKNKSITKFLNLDRSSPHRHKVKKVMILGGGKIGYYLAQRLLRQGIEVKIIEENYDRCIELSEQLPDALVIHGNGTDIDLLEDESIEKMDAFVAVTGHDEDNLFMCLRAKQLRVKKVIAKISKQSHKYISERLGIDVALNPVEITAAELIKYIQGGQIVSISFLLGENVEVIEILVDEKFKYIGKRIKQIPFPEGVLVGAMMHDKNVIIPNGETKIHMDDRLIIFSLADQFSAIERFFKHG